MRVGLGKTGRGASAVGIAGAAAIVCGACGSGGSGVSAVAHDAGTDAAAAAPIDASSPQLPPPADDASTPDDATSAPDAAAFACAGKTGAKGDRTLSLTSGGYPRTSLFHVPSSYDPARGMPLVLSFHGFGSDATQQTLLTNMTAASDARGFVVAYPQGIGNGWNAGDCCTETQPANVDDVAFVRDLLALIQRDYCIDPRRVYATGMSNGGFMSHRLACAMSDVFAAVAPVAGVLGIAPAACTPSRAVPIMDFHGTADGVVSYDGGGTTPDPFRQGFASVSATMNFWRLHDACLSAPETTYAKGDATCVRWGGCTNGADLTLCTIDGGGHTWPGGLAVPTLGKTSTDLDATNAMVDFFFSHPMPASP